MAIWTKVCVGLDFMTHSEEVDELRKYLKEKKVADVIHILPQMETSDLNIIVSGEIDSGSGFDDSITIAEKAAAVLKEIYYNVTIVKRRNFKAIDKAYNWR